MADQKKVIIWGAGNQGRSAYYTLKNEYDILGFYDSNRNKIGEEIIDQKIVLEHLIQNVFIVIACTQWQEVSKLLQQKGLKPVKDFLPYHMFVEKDLRIDRLLDHFGAKNVVNYLCEARKKKKIALIYGNCQTEILANMMEYNQEFHMQYILLRVPQVHLYRGEEQIEQIFYQSGIMQLLDLFIFQNVKSKNRFYARLGTDSLIKQLSGQCRKLPIHNIYFDGYFIQYNADESRYFNNMNQQDFPYADSIVDFYIETGKSTEEILEMIHDENLMEAETIIKRCEISLNELKQREYSVEVPIVDFIEENYCREQLFYTCNHPKNLVLYEYVKRIFHVVGISQTDCFTEEELYLEFGNLRINNFPILPCVIKALGLAKYESKMRISNVSSKLITMDEYIKEYIMRCCKKH